MRLEAAPPVPFLENHPDVSSEAILAEFDIDGHAGSCLAGRLIEPHAADFKAAELSVDLR